VAVTICQVSLYRSQPSCYPNQSNTRLIFNNHIKE
jgi:hypothetical protein